MNRKKTMYEIDKIIEDSPLGDVRKNLLDYIEGLLDSQAEEGYNNYYGINQDDEMTKGCDEYHARQDAESERSAAQ